MNIVRLLTVGDISLQTKNGVSPFNNVKDIFRGADLLFGNLETVLSINAGKVEKAVVLSSSPENAEYLKEAGFDILNLANNHILDLGIKGFMETLNVLRKNKLSFIGVNDKPGQNFLVIKKKGIKFGFLGYTEGVYNLPQKGVWINKIDLRDIKNDIEQIKPQCDFIIVSLHWGIENVFYPSPKQIEIAHSLIDSGVAVILGHHPHVIQGIEQYRNGLIAYSLGNFQFNPKLSYTKANDTVILSLEFSKKALKGYDIFPGKIDEKFTPYIPTKKEQEEVKRFISQISHDLRIGKITDKWWFQEIGKEYLSGNIKSWIIRIKKYGIKHSFQFLKWTISPFTAKCYMGALRRCLRDKKND